MIWKEPEPVEVPDDLLALAGGRQVIAARLVRSGFGDAASARRFIDPGEYSPASPFELPDMDRAVERLSRAIAASEPVLVWGDFDVDGQSATALLHTALKELGADVRYHVPLRHGEGHGIFIPKLREWLDRGVSLIVTCDTGISAHESIDLARRSGVDCIVTDHHLPEPELPPAHSVINPQRLPEGHPLRDLPGVGVAWQLVAALSGATRAGELLDLAALGIVADVARQRLDTRHMLQRGLEAMRITSRPGLRALMDLAGIDPLELTESDIGFGLAPRLNAQGRLSDARDSVELLTTDDPARARDLANQLESLNARRKLESRMIEDGARSLIERDPSLLEYAAIVLSYPGWSGGVAGIVAGRLAETHRKPVVLLCEEGELAFGSARSVPGVNITEAIGSCRDLLLKFGGHPQAAGLTLRRDDVFDFRRRLSQAVREIAPLEAAEPALEIDGYLTLGEVTAEFARDLRRLAPFGNGNPALALGINGLSLVRSRGLGRRGDHLELTVEDPGGTRRKVLWWNAGNEAPPETRFDIACTLRLGRFKGRIEPVLELIDIRPVEDELIEIAPSGQTFTVEDLRSHPDPETLLKDLRNRDADSTVWVEGVSTPAGHTRDQLQPAETLIVWTIPPGPDEWAEALETVRPRRIVIIGAANPELSTESFLKRLGGLLNFAIASRGGQTSIRRLAAATAQRETAVRYGLMFYAASGQISFDLAPDGSLAIERISTGPSHTERESLERLLGNVLEEAAAYRRNWNPERL